MGEVCLLGGLLVGLGLKLVSVAGCWAAGLRCWLRLELRLGSAVLGRVAGWARPVSYTLGPEAG